MFYVFQFVQLSVINLFYFVCMEEEFYTGNTVFVPVEKSQYYVCFP